MLMFFIVMQILFFGFTKAFNRKETFSCLNRMMMSSSSVGRIISPKSPLISGSEAISLLGTQNVRFIDGSWHLNKSRVGKEEFLQSRIPGAQFFDIESVSDKSSSLPHMLPSAEVFSQNMESMGISSTDHVVVYVKPDSFSGPRVWWTFRAFGHEKVSLIDGGLKAWIEAGGPLDTTKEVNMPVPGQFQAILNKKLVVDWKQVLQVVENGSSQILDARSNARFLGQAPEPRAGLRGGHIPGSLSIPFSAFVEKDDVTKFKSPEVIKSVLEESGVIIGTRLITTCGSGVTAAVLSLGQYLLTNDLETAPIYDGSWSEWGANEDLPVINPSNT